jgi:hypothetical protein
MVKFLRDIIAHFENFIGLFNICEAVDKIHIPLMETFGLFIIKNWSQFFRNEFV